MIYDKHAYKTVVVISSYIDEFFFLALYLSLNDGNNFIPMDFSEKWILSKCNCIVFLRILQCYALPTCTLCSITEDFNLISTTAQTLNLILLINCWEKKVESISFLSLPSSLQTRRAGICSDKNIFTRYVSSCFKITIWFSYTLMQCHFLSLLNFTEDFKITTTEQEIIIIPAVEI